MKFFKVLMEKNTLKKTIFGSIFIISGTLLVVFSLFILIAVYQSGIDNSMAILRQRNLAMKNYVLWYFMPLKNAVEALTEQSVIKKGMLVTAEEKEHILELYRLIKTAIPNINYVYSGYEDKNLFINDYDPPPGYDPTVRPWYQKALAAHPIATEGIPYQEIKDQSWLVSISKTIVDRNGKIVGVLSIDASMEDISKQIRVGEERLKTSYSYVIDRDNKIIIHHDPQFIGRNLNDLIHPNADFKKLQGQFEYRIDGIHKIAYYHRIDELGWIIITVANKNEIIQPLILRVILILAAVLIVALVSGKYMSSLLIEKLISPLVTLEFYLKESNNDFNQKLDFPDNEIGRLTCAIQQITSTELYKKNQQLLTLNAQLEQLSITDPLTGLFNRRKMLQDIKNEKHRIDRYASKASILMFDIDHFKYINDTYGHTEGDIILKELAILVKETIRTTDVLGRWGGEEFIILLPETDLSDGAVLAEKIRKIVKRHVFSTGRKITISIGVVELKKNCSIEDSIQQVDAMLYRAKEKGRNRVEITT